MNKETEATIKGVLEDSIRFGAAIGSWAKSQVPWHQMAGERAIEAVRDCAFYVIKTAIDD